MGSPQAIFSYTQEQLDSLLASLSKERLTPYLALTGQDLVQAVKRYEQNTFLSEALYTPLQGLEITLRNTIHRYLSQAKGDYWFDSGLEKIQAHQLSKAREILSQQGKEITPGRLVAELSFGFWTGLLGRAYAKSIWDRYLQDHFKGLKRSTVAERLNKVRLLRNRVAHHEPILNRNLEVDYREVIGTIEWLCPITAQWLDQTSCFMARITQFGLRSIVSRDSSFEREKEDRRI